MIKSWRKFSNLTRTCACSTCHHQRRRPFQRARLVRFYFIFHKLTILKRIFKKWRRFWLDAWLPAGHTGVGEKDTMPSFNDKDRLMFLKKICGIQELSHCVKSEAQTESLRPCPSMQTTVRSVVPYIQRFLRSHEELNEVYSELVYNNIAEKIKRLKFGQVRQWLWENLDSSLKEYKLNCWWNFLNMNVFLGYGIYLANFYRLVTGGEALHPLPAGCCWQWGHSDRAARCHLSAEGWEGALHPERPPLRHNGNLQVWI